MNKQHANLLGIGIVTRNRLPTLQRCVAEIVRHTRVPYILMIADDGSSDGTVPWARAQGIPVVTGDRRGCAWNKNRALYFLQQYTDCDLSLLFEDDTWPIMTGWDMVWLAAALRWQHVNYCYGFDSKTWPKGTGTAADPYQCPAFGGHCTITTRDALAAVGFLDTRFIGFGWEHVEWTHRFRLRYATSWGLPEGMLPCLDFGVRATWPKSLFNQEELDHNGSVYAAIRANITGPYYCAAWQNESERLQLEREVAGASVRVDGASHFPWLPQRPVGWFRALATGLKSILLQFRYRGSWAEGRSRGRMGNSGTMTKSSTVR